MSATFVGFSLTVLFDARLLFGYAAPCSLWIKSSKISLLSMPSYALLMLGQCLMVKRKVIEAV